MNRRFQRYSVLLIMIAQLFLGVHSLTHIHRICLEHGEFLEADDHHADSENDNANAARSNHNEPKNSVLLEQQQIGHNSNHSHCLALFSVGHNYHQKLITIPTIEQQEATKSPLNKVREAFSSLPRILIAKKTSPPRKSARIFPAAKITG